MEIKKGVTPRSYLITIYGKPGIGKSTIAAMAPSPLFIDVDNGLSYIDCHKLDQPKSYEEMIEQLRFASSQKGYETIVIDTLLGVSQMIESQVLKENNADNFKDTKKFPFGLGNELLIARWTVFISILKMITVNSKKNVICLGHDIPQKVKNPSGDDYQRHSINMTLQAVDKFVAEMDAVLYADYEKIFTPKAGTDQRTVFATGKRHLLTQEKLYCIAKNRMGLAEKIPFNNKEDILKLFEVMKK